MVYPSCTGITGNSLRYNACAVVSSTIFLLGCLWQSLKKKKKKLLSSVCVEKNAKRRTSNQEVLRVASVSQCDDNLAFRGRG